MFYKTELTYLHLSANVVGDQSSLLYNTHTHNTGTYPHRFIKNLSKIIWNTPDTFHCEDKGLKSAANWRLVMFNTHKTYRRPAVGSPGFQWSLLRCCPRYQSHRSSCRCRTLGKRRHARQHFHFRATLTFKDAAERALRLLSSCT